MDWVAETWARGLRPEPRLTVSTWADQHRVLGPITAEPGPWRTRRTPYLRAIMDALSVRSPVRKVVWMKAAQMAGTEAALNWLGYVMHHAPGPFLFVEPTVDLAKRLSRQKLDPLIAETPVLRGRVRSPRSRDAGNTVLVKLFPGGMVVLTGANSAVGLRSMSARFLCFDEVDAYPTDIESEGDPIALAEARARTFTRRKVFLLSTPTIAGMSRIEREYQATDQRRYFVPCPHCGQHQVLEFVRLHWTPGQPESVTYTCAACGMAIREAAKARMLAAGEWRATNGAATDPSVVGFHLNAMYAPWLPWADIAREGHAARLSKGAGLWPPAGSPVPLEEAAHVARHAPQIGDDMAIRAVGALDQPHEVACPRHVERVARVSCSGIPNPRSCLSRRVLRLMWRG